MKTIVIATVVIVLGVLGGVLLIPNKVEEFVAPAVVEKLVTQEVEVETLQKRIDDAITASSTDIETASQKAYEDMKTQMRKEVELRVRTEYENELKAQRIELEKEVGVYWTRERVVSLIKSKAQEHGVSAQTMQAVVDCESQYDIDVQSQHRYTPTNVPKGYKVGDREQSFGLVQVHLPAHPNITKAQAIDPEFAVEFLATNLAAGNGNMWSCMKTIAMR